MSLTPPSNVEPILADEAAKSPELAILESMIAHAPLGLAYLDRELRYRRINAQLACMNGMSREAHLGRTVDEIVPTLAPRVREIVNQIVAMGEAVNNTELAGEAVLAPGVPRVRNESWYPVRNDRGEIMGFGVVAEDVTDRRAAERELRKANEKLETVLTSITDGVAVFDHEWRYVFFNEQGAQMLGVRVEDVIGKCVWDLYPRAKELKFYSAYHEAVETRKPVHVEDYYPEPLDMWLSCQCYPSDEGLAVYFNDITVRMRAEEKLQQNADLFARLIDQAPMAIYVVDADFRLAQINPIARPTFRTVSPLLGRDFSEIMHVLWESTVAQGIVNVFRRTLETGERYVSPPFTKQRNDLGVVETYEWETQRVFMPDGRFGVVCYFRDTTEQARAERQLRESEERVRLATEATGVGIWEWHVKTNRICWDAQMFRLYGLPATADGIIDYTTWSAAVHPEDLPAQEASLLETVRTCGHGSRTFRIRRGTDGAERIIEAVEMVRKNFEGGAEWVVGTNLDITERRQAENALRQAKEAAEAANRAKDHFMAVLSHELRTPLTPVLMSICTLEMDPTLAPDVREDFAMMKRNIELETKLIDDLLDLSRISAGKLALDLQPLDLNDIVRVICKLAQPQVREAGIALDCALDETIGHVAADSSRLQQALWNVIRNAIKFTPTGGSITVRTARLTEDRCEVRVRDNGRGIPPEMLPRIFDAFEQGGSHVNRQFGGLGLGLAICKALLDLHGGTIRAESEGEKCGATFIIELPMRVGQLAPVRGPVAAPAESVLVRPRILLVEDHADTARALVVQLRRVGYPVTLATDVASALEASEREPFDVLVSDLGLPDASGYELMRLLRTKGEVRGIAMSGYGMDEDIQRSLAAGFAEHLVKPLGVPKLDEAIRRVMRRAPSPRT